jgi:hypothetical protein
MTAGRSIYGGMAIGWESREAAHPDDRNFRRIRAAYLRLSGCASLTQQLLQLPLCGCSSRISHQG